MDDRLWTMDSGQWTVGTGGGAASRGRCSPQEQVSSSLRRRCNKLRSKDNGSAPPIRIVRGHVRAGIGEPGSRRRR